MTDSDASASQAPTAGLLHVSVVTPEGAAYEGDARSAIVPAHDGEVAFLPGHAAFVGAIGVGEMRIEGPDGAAHRWYLEGGVVQVLGDVVTVLAEQVMPSEKVDGESAARELEEALAIVPTSPEEFEDRDRRVAAARARLQVARTRA